MRVKVRWACDLFDGDAQVVENNGRQVNDDEKGKSWDRSGAAGDFGPARESEGGQPAAVGKDERASGGVSPERFVSWGDGRHSAVGEADVDWQGCEMGGVVFAADVDEGYADDAGSGSDEAWDKAGGVSGGCG